VISVGFKGSNFFAAYQPLIRPLKRGVDIIDQLAVNRLQ